MLLSMYTDIIGKIKQETKGKKNYRILCTCTIIRTDKKWRNTKKKKIITKTTP